MRLRKVCPQCNTVVHAKRSVCDCGHAFEEKESTVSATAVGKPENAMKRRKALLSEEELLVTKERDKQVRNDIKVKVVYKAPCIHTSLFSPHLHSGVKKMKGWTKPCILPSLLYRF